MEWKWKIRTFWIYCIQEKKGLTNMKIAAVLLLLGTIKSGETQDYGLSSQQADAPSYQPLQATSAPFARISMSLATSSPVKSRQSYPTNEEEEALPPPSPPSPPVQEFKPSLGFRKPEGDPKPAYQTSSRFTSKPGYQSRFDKQKLQYLKPEYVRQQYSKLSPQEPINTEVSQGEFETEKAAYKRPPYQVQQPQQSFQKIQDQQNLPVKHRTQGPAYPTEDQFRPEAEFMNQDVIGNTEIQTKPEFNNVDYSSQNLVRPVSAQNFRDKSQYSEAESFSSNYPDSSHSLGEFRVKENYERPLGLIQIYPQSEQLETQDSSTPYPESEVNYRNEQNQLRPKPVLQQAAKQQYTKQSFTDTEAYPKQDDTGYKVRQNVARPQSVPKTVSNIGYSTDEILPESELVGGFSPERQQFIDEPDYTDSSTNVPGEPGKDYPVFGVLPQTSFTCEGNPPGFYADPDTKCQVWHYCDTEGKKESFLCSNGTMYNQEKRVCDWWFNVDCSQAQTFYKINEDLYIVPEKQFVQQQIIGGDFRVSDVEGQGYKPQVSQEQDRKQKLQQKQEQYSAPEQSGYTFQKSRTPAKLKLAPQAQPLQKQPLLRQSRPGYTGHQVEYKTPSEALVSSTVASTLSPSPRKSKTHRRPSY